jgi:hypothetical protein
MAEYYSQRASVPGTLLFTEATYISPAASGYANAPAIYSAAQIEGWRRVPDAVHAKAAILLCDCGPCSKPDSEYNGTYDACKRGRYPDTASVEGGGVVRFGPTHAFAFTAVATAGHSKIGRC